MKVIYPQDTFSSSSCVGTVGYFDGVHAGHRSLINQLNNTALTAQKPSVVFTFQHHPRTITQSDFQPRLLTPLDEKLELLTSLNVDTCVILNFDTAMSLLTASEFLQSVLRDQFKVDTLLIGHNHRFGHNRQEGFAEYQKYGDKLAMNVLLATKHTTETDLNISSTAIRNALDAGDIQLANRLLSYPYSITGTVIEGFKVGRTIGFPTANIQPRDKHKLIPALGAYVVKIHIGNNIYTGMLNIGKRPTVDNGNHISIEAHIINFNEDIYRQEVKIEFVDRIRDERKFENMGELAKQLEQDKKFTIRHL
jgi:riboflavin kinase / FMN adenylyltransferase